MRQLLGVLIGSALLLLSSGEAANAGGRAATTKLAPAEAEAIDQALQEGRLLDAGQLIDQARTVAGADPQLALFGGQLGLARRQHETALQDFKAAEAHAQGDPTLRAAALEGQGLALMAAGKNDQARPLLEQATTLSPDVWRAWNALGVLDDGKRDWGRAAAAYEKALTTSRDPSIVLNNRGYSRLLQGRGAEAQADFVAALEKRPDLVAARTNLRLALALQGNYSSAVAGGTPAEQAALLNNAGFAAGARGDYVKARELLTEAMKTRGEYYVRASENLRLFQSVTTSPGP